MDWLVGLGISFALGSAVGHWLKWARNQNEGTRDEEEQ